MRGDLLTSPQVGLQKLFSIIIWMVFCSVVMAFDIDLAVKDISDAPSWTGMNSESIRKEGPKLCAVLKKYCNAIRPEEARNLVAKLSSMTQKIESALTGKSMFLTGCIAMFLNERIYATGSSSEDGVVSMCLTKKFTLYFH